MKKIVLIIVALTMTMAAKAQYYRLETPFTAGKYFVGASLSGLNLNYSGANDLSFGVQAQGGLMVDDNVLVYATVGFDNNGKGCDAFTAGVGGRYYIEQNGIFLGLNANYKHIQPSYNDLMPGVEVGYAFFLSRTVTIEPAVYYNQSFKNHSDYSEFGLKVGFGIYL